MNTPIRESGNSSEAKNNARINDGIPEVNMRKDRKVMIMYASRPVARREVIPRKPAMPDRIDMAIAGLLVAGNDLLMVGGRESLLLVTDRNVLGVEDGRVRKEVKRRRG
jgi:hypothetical protein